MVDRTRPPLGTDPNLYKQLVKGKPGGTLVLSPIGSTAAVPCALERMARFTCHENNNGIDVIAPLSELENDPASKEPARELRVASAVYANKKVGDERRNYIEMQGGTIPPMSHSQPAQIRL